MKNDIRLIDDQINGNLQDLDLQSIERSHLENALKTYSMMVMDLQNKLDVAYRKIAEYENEKLKYL